MVTIHILLLLVSGVSESEVPEIPVAAKHAVEREVRFYKQASVEEPYYRFLSDAAKIMADDFKPGNLIPNYAIDTRWFFPVSQQNAVVEVWRVCQAGDEYRTCGMMKSSEHLREFLKRRRKLKPRYELALLRINGVGNFWVVHQKLVAKAIIPIDNGAWKTLTGKRTKLVDGWKVGDKYNMKIAVRRMRESAAETLEYYAE